MDLHSLMGCTAFTQILERRAHDTPEQVAFVFLENGERPGPSRTFHALYRNACLVADRLSRDFHFGDRALLLFEPGLSFVDAFFGCLLAGVTAVPLPAQRSKGRLAHLDRIAHDAQASVMLSTRPLLEKSPAWEKLGAGFADNRRIAVDDLVAGASGAAPTPTAPIDGETLALLQYTSGSTGVPKGVMVRHANLLANSLDLADGETDFSERVMVSWLPTYHDMGLIYGVLQPIYGGYPAYLMAPAAFLQKPIRWLRAISRFGGTNSAAPNFAYQLCTRQISTDQCRDLDLSSWRTACNGAEPIRAVTLKRFSETFAPYGFQAKAHQPGYGLAEATLKVTSLKEGDEPLFLQRDHREHVGCGISRIDTRIRIVDPQSQTPLPEDHEGEVWVAGSTVTGGYWDREEETERTFRAFTTEGDGPFLRTGDLGFLHDGQLFIVDRMKDMILHHGRNYYPRDIEITAWESHPALREDCCAAFAVEDENGEHAAVVIEVARTRMRDLAADEVVAAVRRAVGENHGLPLQTVALIRQASLPKTSSGKVRRRACRQMLADGSLRLIHIDHHTHEVADLGSTLGDSEPTGDDLLDVLIGFWEEVLGCKKPPVGTPFFALGGDSVAAVQIAARVRTQFGIEVPDDLLFEADTIRQQASWLRRQGVTPAAPTGATAFGGWFHAPTTALADDEEEGEL